MLNRFTQTDPGQLEADIVEIAKCALPPTKEEWNRYDELRDRYSYYVSCFEWSLEAHYALTKEQCAELAILSAKARRVHRTPEAKAAEQALFAKYGPTTGTATPRRAITNQQSVTEKALASAFYAHGRGVEQPFAERTGNTMSIEEYERKYARPKDERGVNDEFEKAQEVERKTLGPGDGFKLGNEKDDGKLPLLGVFPAYLGMPPWIIWDAIREFDPAKRKAGNPDPLGAVIYMIAQRRSRHELARLPHGTKRSQQPTHDHSQHDRTLDVMEEAFEDAMAKADASAKLFLKMTGNAVDAAVLEMWWPLPDINGIRPAAVHASEIARRLDCHRSIISRRLDRLRKQIPQLDYAIVIWEELEKFTRGQISWSELATNPSLAGIINRWGAVPPLVKPERRSTGVFVSEPPYDPYHQCKRRVRLKNGQRVNLTCQRAGSA